MALDKVRHLRVLIANEKRERLELLAQVVAGLGHEVIAREIYVKEVGAVTARERPDVALVGLGLHSEHALDLITEIVREASCPVIALLTAKDPAYVHEAAKRGVFAYIVEDTPEELQSAIDITLQRFAEYPTPQRIHPQQSGWSRIWPTSTSWSASMLRPGGTDGGDSRCGYGRHAHTRTHAPPWQALRPLVGLVRPGAKRSSRSFGVGIAVGRRGDRRRPIMARSRRSRFGQGVGRRSLLRAGRPAAPHGAEGTVRMT